MSTADGLSSLC